MISERNLRDTVTVTLLSSHAKCSLPVASIYESEILRIQNDAVLQKTKKATKFGLKVFKGKSSYFCQLVFDFVFPDNYC